MEPFYYRNQQYKKAVDDLYWRLKEKSFTWEQAFLIIGKEFLDAYVEWKDCSKPECVEKIVISWIGLSALQIVKNKIFGR